MKKVILSVVAIAFFSFNSYSQGCSDAGFCSMGAMRPSQVYNKKINFRLRELEVSYYKGATHVTPTINAATLDFNFGINDDISMQVKLPYMWINGSLGETSALGDISLSFTKNLKSTEDYHINGTLGTKIPTNRSDIKKGSNVAWTTDGEERVLPMYYQTSLGSYDLILGASYMSKKWMFASGFQFALTENSNSYDSSEWGEYPFPAYLDGYAEATNLKRGIDFMIRVERAFHFSKWDIRLGLLPIFRVTKDQIETDNGDNVKVNGTTGMALTAIGNVAYHFNTKQSVKLLYGMKVTDRDINPDGLTRNNVVSISYAYRF